MDERKEKRGDPYMRRADVAVTRFLALRRVVCVLVSSVMVFCSIPHGSLAYASELIATATSEMAGEDKTGAAGTIAETGKVSEGPTSDDSRHGMGISLTPETVRVLFFPGEYDEGNMVRGHMDPYEFVLDGEPHAIPVNEFVREGFEFAGWCTTADGHDVADDASTQDVNEEMTAMTLRDSQALVDLDYDEEQVQVDTDSYGNEVQVTRLVPRSLLQAVRDGTVTLYALWTPLPEASTAVEEIDAAVVVRQRSDDGTVDDAWYQPDYMNVEPDVRDSISVNDSLEQSLETDPLEVHISTSGELNALLVGGAPHASENDLAHAIVQDVEMPLEEARGLVQPLAGVLLRAPAPMNDLPREADGTTIEAVSAVWVTPDTVDNGDEALLYLRPGNDAPVNARMRVNYALSGEHDYEVGDLTITVPATMFAYRDGREAGSLAIPYPEEPKSSNDFNWTRKGDTYVLSNTRRLQAASKGYIEFEVSGIVPHRVVDMAQSDPFWASVEIVTHRGNTIRLTSNEIRAQIDTEEIVDAATEFCSDVSVVDASHIPEEARSDGEDQYVVVTWYHYANVSGNTEFTLDVWDRRADAYEGTMISQSISAGGQIVSERIFEGFGAANMGYKAVQYAYPLSQFQPNVTYTFKNDVGYVLTEIDPAVGDDPQRVTSKETTASIEWMRRKQEFVLPEGNLLLVKYGNDGAYGTNPAPYATHFVEDVYGTYYDDYPARVGIGIYPYALNGLRDERDQEVAYTVETSGHLLPWTLEGDPQRPSDYGKRSVSLVTYDVDDSLGDPITLEGRRLIRGVDYAYKAVEFPEKPYIGAAQTVNLSDSGGFIYVSGEDATIGYVADNDSSHIPPIALEARVGGVWRQIAIADWTSGTLRLECRDALSVDNRVLLPESTEQVRTVVSSTNASIQFVYRPILTVYASGTVGAATNAAFEVTSMPRLTLKNTSRLEASDAGGAQIGVLHAEGYDSLRGFSTDIAAIPSKDVSQTSADVDYDARKVTLHYSARVEERSLIPDRLTYQQALADGQIVEERQGVWYDLLPKGVTPVMSSIRLRAQDYVQEVHTIEDYKGSGRTLLVVKANLTPSPTWYSDGPVHRVMDVPSISFDATYSFDSIKDHGSTVHNVIAFESLSRDSIGTVSGYGGEPDNPRCANNVLTARAFVDEDERIAMTGLDNGTAGNRFVYAGISKNLEILSAARTSLSKDVEVNDDGVWSQGTYDNKRDVYVGGRYVYRLRMMSDARTDSSNLVLFDSLENFHAGEGNDEEDVGAPRWRGELARVDTSQLVSKGVAPVVYYSSVADLSLADESDPTHANATNTDLSNGAIWVRAQDYAGALSEVRAVAIDCSKAADGTDFVLHPLESIVAAVHMHAPKGEVARELVAQDAHAYNNAFLTCTSTDTSLGIDGDSQNFVRHDYTKVGLIQHDIVVQKTWSDDDDRDGMRPQTVRVHLYADGIDTGLSQVLEGADWTAKFENVPYLNDDGSKIRYSVVEDVPQGYVCGVTRDGNAFTVTNVHQPEVVALVGEKTWSGGEEFVPRSISVRLLADGRVVATRQVAPDQDGRWLYSFGNQLKYRDGGVPIVYTLEEVIDQSKWMCQSEGMDLHNVYHPYGNVRIEKEAIGQSDAFMSKRFRFVLEFFGEDGLACADSFVYVTSDGRRGMVGNGDVVEIASGESATVQDIPHDMRYSVREEEEVGYEAVAQDGSSGTVLGNRTVTAHFTNVYTAKGSVNLNARKTLAGRTLQRHQFRCEIRDMDGTILRSATNEADGSVSFGAINYTQADAGKTFEYRIVETVRALPGYVYDESVYRAFVEVIDNGDGTLRGAVRYTDEQGNPCAMPLFENRYHASGELELRAWKELKGRDCQPGEFTFELRDEQGTVMDTQQNDAHAEVHFAPLAFDESDSGETRYFEVREARGDDADVVYDETTYAYAVTVLDNGDGTLGFSQQMVDPEDMWASGDGGMRLNPSWEHNPQDVVPVFHNVLKPGGLRIEKRVDSVEESHRDDEFTFAVQLRDEDDPLEGQLSYRISPVSSSVAQDANTFTANVADGWLEFSLRANEAATFEDCIPAGTNYSVYEKARNGWILVSQSDTTGTIRPRSTSVASFKNLQDDSATSVSLMGTKTIDGRPAAANEFEFSLRDENGELERVHTSAGGGIVFSPIRYTRSDIGSHAYTVVEVVGDDEAVVYDEHEERVTVEVSEDGSNLVALVTYDDDGMAFSNVTRPGSLRIRKEVEGGGDPGQEFEFEVELKNATSSVMRNAAAETSQPESGISRTMESLGGLAVGLIGSLGELFAPRKAYAATVADTEAYWKVDDAGALHISRTNTDGTYEGPANVRLGTYVKPPWYAQRTKIRSVVIDGDFAPQRTAMWFYQCSNLTDISGLAALDMSMIDNINYMFYQCYKLEDISVLAQWDTSSVQSTGSMFYECTSLRDLSPLANWRFDSITAGYGMYYESINYMFYGCTSLTDISPLANWDVSNVEYFRGIFWNCTALEDIAPLARWDVRRAYSFASFFKGCVLLKNIEPLRSWRVAKPTSLESFFEGCTSLTNIEVLSQWNTSNTKYFNYMFSHCTNLRDISPLRAWDVHSAVDMAMLFRACVLLEDLTPLARWNVGNLSRLEYMFEGCTSLQTVDALSGWNTSKGTQFFYTFANCTSLHDISGLSSWQFQNADNIGSFFAGCTSLTDITPISGWTFGKLRYMRSLFERCSSLTDVSCISDWDTSKVIGMKGVFDNCTSLERADISGWDLSKITKADDYPTFRYDLNLKRLTVSTASTLVETNSIPEHSAHDGYKSTWMLEGTDVTGKTARQMIGLINGHQYVGTWVWEVDSNAAIVEFNPNGGIINGQARVVQVGSVTPVSMCLASRPGFELSGWNTQPDGTGTHFATDATITPVIGETIVLYAQWEDPATFVDYTVVHRLESSTQLGTYESVGRESRRGSTAHPVVVAPNVYEGFEVPDARTVVLSQDGSSIVVFDYTRCRFDVTLDGKGVVENQVQQFVYGVRQALSPAPAIEGKTFVGWTKNEDGSGVLFADRQSVSFREATTLYAQYLDSSTTSEQHGSTVVMHLKARAGETVSIPNIAAGTTYEVREVNMPKGWTQKEIVGSSGVVRANEASIVTAKNTYSASGAFDVCAYKDYQGDELTDGAFAFSLERRNDADGTWDVVSTVANSDPDDRETVDDSELGVPVLNVHRGQAPVRFVDIPVASVGTFTYRIREVAGEETGVEYDTHAEYITVVATDNYDGTLKTSVGYGEHDPVFYNRAVTGAIEISKLVEGASVASDGTRFSFGLYVRDKEGIPFTASPLEVRTTTKDGGRSVAYLSFVNGQTMVSLAGGEVARINGLPIGAHFEIEENPSDGWVLASQSGSTGTVSQDTIARATFQNRYEPSGSFEVSGRKVCRNLSLVEGEFSFVLMDEGGGVVARATNDADGAFRFSSLPIDPSWVGEVKVFHVREEDTGQKYVRYDSHVEDIVVSFSDDGAGHLQASVTYDDDGCNFLNEYSLAMPSTGLAGMISMRSWLPFAVMTVTPGIVSVRRHRQDRD